VAPEHVAELDRLVGEYAKGTTPVYRGSLSANDNMGSLGPTYKDGHITEGNAIASLATIAAGSGAPTHTLTVFSPNEQRHLVLTQTADAGSGGPPTSVSFVLTDPTSGGVSANALGVPVLAGGPAQIALTLDANGQWGTGQPMHVTGAGNLARVAPATLAFNDVVHLNAGTYADQQAMLALVPSGTDAVRTVKSELHEPTTVPSGTTFYACHHVTSYAIDQYVERANLTNYGVRNLKIEKAETCCVDSPENEKDCTPANRTCF
jgi:hypothetical protein